MATEELQPVAAENTVATPTSVAPAMNAEPLLPTLNASAVYAPSNVQQVLTKSSKTYKKMKLSKLEKQIAKANSQAELNQINIENTPVAMGVITGQASQQSKLDTARLNAVTGLYNAKLLDEQRKEAERQQFISTYGADPKSRPKGMSKREFSKAIQGGGFQNLLTEDFKQKQLQTAAAQKSLSGGSGSGSDSGSNNLQAEIMSLRDSGVSWGDASAIIEKKYGMMPGDQTSQIMDYVYGGIKPTAPLTVAQQQAQVEAEQKAQEAQQIAEQKQLESADTVKAIEELEKSSGLNNAVGPGKEKWYDPRNFFTRKGQFFSSSKNAFIGKMQNILDQVTMDKLIEVKGQGATFGALSDKEREMIQRAASPIWQWVVTDSDGKIVGYNIDEKTFKEELTRLKKKAAGNNDPLGLGF